MTWASRCVEIGQVGPRQREATNNPDGGEYGGDKIGRTGRTALERAQDLADRLPVVVRGKRRGHITANPDGFAVEIVVEMPAQTARFRA